MAKKTSTPGSIQNRRARFDYQLGDSFVVGIVLNGRETKALRMGHGQLSGAYVTIKDNELWLLNATVNSTQNIQISDSEQTRTRKLLASRQEIARLAQAKNEGLTIIPLEILTKGRFIKVKIATARGKRQYDKRQTIKARDQERVNNAELKRFK